MTETSYDCLAPHNIMRGFCPDFSFGSLPDSKSKVGRIRLPYEDGKKQEKPDSHPFVCLICGSYGHISPDNRKRFKDCHIAA